MYYLYPPSQVDKPDNPLTNEELYLTQDHYHGKIHIYKIWQISLNARTLVYMFFKELFNLAIRIEQLL